ncbi:phenylalanyl-tRNA synthetase mitochondrial precursor [Lophium mytilinum]|uniref:Phenylalanine--tRNA ligase, mitochondrial n=1 Tax=Lophium mytilinum TaxID=390894 RepID=A0A6A6R1Q3_9PEZI|nr:phenylalanyl-tRNA synthetase mitochondrial precursor [Lophium mytilinum]
MNTPPSILSALKKRLHLQPDHPLAITRQLIESRFPGYAYHNALFPIVTTHQNFDSLGFPPDHPGRSRTDTYYINSKTVLRTHTSAHQADTFRANATPGYLISADVYRRDAVDRSHYPVFHQMEGAMTWDRTTVPTNSTLAAQIWADVAKIPSHDLTVQDPNPTIDADRNPLQPEHAAAEVEAVAAHLKRSLEDVVVAIFSAARAATTAGGEAPADEPLQIRWVEAYFPFTSPSWELEVFWQGEWLEVLGCGVVRHSILANAGVPSRIGWAFGLGLERIAMLLFSIPDIRLFWSEDARFLSQFSASKPIARFARFSKFPACFKDMSFWLPAGVGGNSAGGQVGGFHENDVMELVREVAGDLAEDVRLVDEFTHPKTGRRSCCYRVNYRSLERTLTNEETNRLHEKLRGTLVERLGVELR